MDHARIVNRQSRLTATPWLKTSNEWKEMASEDLRSTITEIQSVESRIATEHAELSAYQANKLELQAALEHTIAKQQQFSQKLQQLEQVNAQLLTIASHSSLR